jgi:formylglycine-generating enzyme required for sulfatase activity
VGTPIVETGSFRFLERDVKGVLVPGFSDWRHFPPVSGTLDLKGWYSNNSGGETHEVGRLAPNPWMINDLLGNVAEMVQDTYSASYYRDSPSIDPKNTEDNKEFILRGGSWNTGAVIASMWYRQTRATALDIATPWIGFRCVRDREQSKSINH